MKKRFKVSNKLLLFLFVIAVIFSLIAVYFSVYANSAESYTNNDYKSYYAEPPKEAHVGVVINEGSTEDATE